MPFSENPKVKQLFASVFLEKVKHEKASDLMGGPVLYKSCGAGHFPDMELRVVQYGEPVLRKKGAAVTEFDAALEELAGAMIRTMHREEGIGLAAQQIGRELQLCVVDVRPPEGGPAPFFYRYDGKQPPLDLFMPLVLCNPEAEVTDPDEAACEEGCLSFPEIRGRVTRATGIRCAFQDTGGNRHTLEADGLLARCILHEMDHLNGILFIDRMDKRDLKRLDPRLRKLKKASRASAESADA